MANSIREVDFQEHLSGSSTLSSWAFRSNTTVAFPTYLRYGWDLRNPEHTQLLTMFRQKIRVRIKFFSPECTPWSVASQTANPENKALNRERDQPLLQWIVDECKQTKTGDDYLVENPFNSGIWTESNLKGILEINRETYDNLTDQCRHGHQDEEGHRSRSVRSSLGVSDASVWPSYVNVREHTRGLSVNTRARADRQGRIYIQTDYVNNNYFVM